MSQNPNNPSNITAKMNKTGFLPNANLLFEKPRRRGSPEKKERKNALTLSPYEMLRIIAKTKEKEEIVREINNRSREKERGTIDPILDIKSITKEELIREMNNKSRERPNIDTMLESKALPKEHHIHSDSKSTLLNIGVDKKEETNFHRNLHSRNVSSEVNHKRPISKLSLRPSLPTVELDKSVISSPQHKKTDEKSFTPEINAYQGWHVNDSGDNSTYIIQEINKEVVLPSIHKQSRNEGGIYSIFSRYLGFI